MKFNTLHFVFLSSFSTSVLAAADPNFFVSLDKLVEQDAQLQEAQQELEASYADIAFDRAQGRPDASLKAHQGWSKNPTDNLSPLSQMELVTSVNVLAFGRDSLHWKLADIKDQNKSLQQESLYLSAEKRAALLIVDYIASKEYLDLARKMTRSRQRIADVAQARFMKGMLAEPDYKKTTIDLELAQLKEWQREVDFSSKSDQMRYRLAADLRGLSLPFHHLDPRLSDFIKQDHRQSLGEQIAQSTVLEKSLLNDIEAKNRLPSLDLSLSHQMPLSGVQDAHERSTTIAMTLTFPLIDQGSLRTRREQRTNAWRASQARLQNTALVNKENEASLSRTLSLLNATLETRKKLLQTSQSIYETNVKRFSMATISLNDLNIEEERLLQSEGEYTEAQVLLNQKLVEYCSLKGLRFKHCVEP